MNELDPKTYPFDLEGKLTMSDVLHKRKRIKDEVVNTSNYVESTLPPYNGMVQYEPSLTTGGNKPLFVPNVDTTLYVPNNYHQNLLMYNPKENMNTTVKFVKLVILKEVLDEEGFIVDYEFFKEVVVKVGPKVKELQFAIMAQVEGFDPETMEYQEVWSVNRSLVE